MFNTFSSTSLEHLLLDSFEHTVQSVKPCSVLTKFVQYIPTENVIAIGAGKAAAAMAAAFEDSYEGASQGVVVTRHGHKLPTRSIKVLEAAHPVPDIHGQNAFSEILELLKNANSNDTIVCLLSGGGSALLSSPVNGVSFEDIQDVTKSLLLSGASIHEINTVRKHLNIALGGGLAKIAYPAKIITLAISDVVGDDPDVIASGPTVADQSSIKDALRILQQYDIDISKDIRSALSSNQNETPKADDKIFEGHEYHLIATPDMALNAAAKFWKDNGFSTFILDNAMEGDTHKAAQKHHEFLKQILGGKQKIKRPCAIISGGELTVQVSGKGQGGPNTQFMLESALLLNGNEKVYGLACDTDGIDGSVDNAGAFITPDTLKRAEKAGLKPAQYLADNNSYEFFKSVNQLIKTGPTYTNVNDYRVFLLLP